MSDLLIDDQSKDLVLSNGDLVLNSGIVAVKQFLEARLGFFKGEWFLDLDSGVPYYEEVLKKNPDPIVLDGIFKDTILSTPGIIGLDSFSMELDTNTRELRLNFKARSLDGEIDFNQTIGV